MAKKYERYGYSLLALCEEVHMAQTGAGDPLDRSSLTRAKQEIQIRLNNWTPSGGSDAYDTAVRLLCIAVLSERGGTMPLCTRKPGHDGPCNGYQADTCR